MANETLVGGSGDDTLSDVLTSPGNDLFQGLAANDSLISSDGADTIDGDTGFDTADFTLRSGSLNVSLVTGLEVNSLSRLIGIEAVLGSGFSDSIEGDAGVNFLGGFGGDDIISGGAGDDLIWGGEGDDDLSGDAGFDTLFFFAAAGGVNANLATGSATGQGTDIIAGFEAIVGTSFDDTLTGDSADNLFNVGTAGMDSVVGGAGFDTISFADADSSVTVDMPAGVEFNTLTTFSGIEAVAGSAFDDSIQGDDNANWLGGNDGADIIDGGAGDDTVEGGEGDDDLAGGDGFDLASYKSAANAVDANLATGRATGQGDDTLTGFEGLIGSAFDDTLTGDSADNLLNVGTAGMDSVVGGAGFDTISFADADSSVTVDMPAGVEFNTLTTFSGIEAVAGSAFDDSIQGDDNANWLGGNDGADIIDGGAGDDTVEGGEGDDDLAGGDGFDLASYKSAATAVDANLATGRATGQGDDTFAGFEGLIGSAFDDTLTGDSADNLLNVGTAGRDSVVGGAGFDTISFADAGGSVNVDMPTGTEFNTLTTFSGIEGVAGSAFDDSIQGDGNANWLGGNDGADIIDGGAGDDTVEGGEGDDDLAGGDGFDLASYKSAANAIDANLATGRATGQGDDTLTGFEGLIGSAFDDTLTGDSADNLLNVGTAGMDSLVGGAGFDTISFADAGGSVNVDMPTGTEFNTLTTFSGIEGVAGSAFDDSIQGDDNANWLGGNDGADIIDGGAGDDTVEGGEGDDDLAGGDGFDLASYKSATNAVSASLATGAATGQGDDTLAGFEGLIGSAFNDTLTGNAANNLLNVGTAGMDSVVGGAGFDTISFADAGGSVNVDMPTGTEFNTLTTFSGIEGVAGSAFDDSIQGDGNANWLGGNAGADIIDGGAGDDTVEGGAGDDDLAGGAGFDLASYKSATNAVSANLATGAATGQGDDTLAGFEGLIGSAFDDTLTGNAANNLLNVGTAGRDSVVGGAGFDTISFADAGGSVNVDMPTGTEFNTLTTFSGIEAVEGSAFDDSIQGDGNANWLSGKAGDDVIDAGAGNDTVLGGTGDDDLSGGTGIDVVSYVGAANAVSVNLATGFATGQGNDTLAGFENATGSNFNDTLIGSGAANVLNVGTGGRDSVVGGAGFDTISFADATSSVNVDMPTGTELNTLTTFSGIEAAIGSAFDDSIAGNDAANWLFGGDGDDVIAGGLGNDTIGGGAGDDDLDGGAGLDDVSYATATNGVTVNLATGRATGRGNDTLAGFEDIIGSGFADSLTGNAGANVINVGTAGRDSVVGGAGYDTISFVSASTSVNVDMTTGTELNTLTTFNGIEAVAGSAFSDSLLGNLGNNWLSGNDGDDVIDAGAGNDTVAGGRGDDALNGGIGFDIVSYASATNGVVANLTTGAASGQGADTISNFEGITGSGFNDRLTGNSANNVLNVGTGGRDTVVGGAGFDTVSFANATTSVSIDLVAGREFNTLSTFTGIEAASGSAFSDSILGTSGANWLGGNAGDDIIDAGAGNDTVSGGTGDDNLDGGTGFDIVSYASATNAVSVNLATTIATGQGNDTVTGFEGVVGTAFSDTLIGNTANNLFNVGSGGADSVAGGLGFDTISFIDRPTGIVLDVGAGTETVSGTRFSGIDAVNGSNAADRITGDATSNWLAGNAGNDTILAGDAADTVNGGAGDDSLDGGTGFDIASFANAAAAVTVNLGTQSATGEGTDVLLAFEGILGSSFADVLIGDVASNSLNGNGGADTLTGAGGADNFLFGAGLANGDDVTDFSGIGGDNDKLVFQGYGVGATFTSLGGGQFEAANATRTIVDVISVTGTVAVGDWVFV